MNTQISNMSLVKAASSGEVLKVQQILEELSSSEHSSLLNSALNIAALHGYIEIVKLLVDFGVDVNVGDRNDMTPLDCAIENMHIDVIEYLLERGADVNAVDRYGETPLHRAVDIEIEEAISCYPDDPTRPASARITKLLVSRGAIVSARNYRGETPLDWAVERGHKAAEKLLISGQNTDIGS